MRLPEFTAEASLGKLSEHYVLISGYRAGASTRSLQPQLNFPEFSWCTFAAIGCLIFNYNCESYYRSCVPFVPPSLPPNGGPGTPPR